MSAYVVSPAFRELVADIGRLKTGLAAVRYCVLVYGDTVTVRDYAGEADYSEEVGETFARFRQDAAKDYLVRFPENANMNHIEAHILDLVAKLNPEVFGFLVQFVARASGFPRSGDRPLRAGGPLLHRRTPRIYRRHPLGWPAVLLSRGFGGHQAGVRPRRV